MLPERSGRPAEPGSAAAPRQREAPRGPRRRCEARRAAPARPKEGARADSGAARRSSFAGRSRLLRAPRCTSAARPKYGGLSASSAAERRMGAAQRHPSSWGLSGALRSWSLDPLPARSVSRSRRAGRPRARPARRLRWRTGCSWDCGGLRPRSGHASRHGRAPHATRGRSRVSPQPSPHVNPRAFSKIGCSRTTSSVPSYCVPRSAPSLEPTRHHRMQVPLPLPV